MKTRVIQVDAKNPDPEKIREAALRLRRGGLVAFPTATAYGLGASLEDPQALQELYQVRQGPFGKQDSLHVSLAEEGAPRGFRVPDHPVALALLRAAAVPVIAPLANVSGNPPPHTAADVLRDLAGRIDLVVDAGPVS